MWETWVGTVAGSSLGLASGIKARELPLEAGAALGLAEALEVDTDREL